MAVVADLHRTFPACVHVALDGYIINPLSVFVNMFTKFSLSSVLKGGIIMARKHICAKEKQNENHPLYACTLAYFRNGRKRYALYNGIFLLLLTIFKKSVIF